VHRLLRGHPFRVFQADYVGAVVMPGGASQPRKQLDAWQEWAKQRGAKGLAYVLVQEDGDAHRPVAKNLSETELAGLAAHVGAQPGDCIFFAAGAPKPSRALLGAARLEIGKRCGLIDESPGAFLWVNDAPLFEPASDAVAAGDVAVGSGAWTAVHHAFTSPKAEFLDTFDTDPGRRWPTPTTWSATATRSAAARSVSTAATCRSASSRSWACRRRRRRRSSASCSTPSPSAPRRTAASPSAGTASSCCSAGYDSIRDVIAFPKSGGGYDPLTEAPAPITPQQRKEAG
jgi:aspartyl-tRNA synthetase